jgi:Domain of unknown function (DUF4440)
MIRTSEHPKWKNGMAKSAPALSLWTLLCVLSHPALADGSSLRSILETQYAVMKSAMTAKDEQGIRALLSPDFVSTDVSGKQEGAAQMILEVKTLPADPQRVSATRLEKITETIDGAQIEQRYEVKTKKSSPDGTLHDIELITLSTDNWINDNGAWRLRSTTTHQMDFFVDDRNVLHRVLATAH